MYIKLPVFSFVGATLVPLRNFHAFISQRDGYIAQIWWPLMLLKAIAISHFKKLSFWNYSQRANVLPHDVYTVWFCLHSSVGKWDLRCNISYKCPKPWSRLSSFISQHIYSYIMGMKHCGSHSNLLTHGSPLAIRSECSLSKLQLKISPSPTWKVESPLHCLKSKPQTYALMAQFLLSKVFSLFTLWWTTIFVYIRSTIH